MWAMPSYLSQLTDDILPFWITNGPDWERGGVQTCWDNFGENLVSDDKYTWSQGRWAWLASAVALAARDGWLSVDPEPWIRTAVATAHHVADHAMLPDGTTAFVTTGDGIAYEPTPGAGLHTSIFVDFFVAMGWAGVARLGADPDTDWAGRATALYHSAVERAAGPQVRTDPYPVPPGHGSWALPMIIIGVGNELFAATGDPDVAARVEAAMDDLAENYLRGDDGVEMPVLDPELADLDSLHARHRTPGHVLECLWFLDDARAVVGDHPLTDPKRLTAIALHSLEIGWDPQYGGLLRYVDAAGGEPSGTVVFDAEENPDPYAILVAQTWRTKLWWIHSEAVFACELLASRTNDPEIRVWRDRVRDWTLTTFPAGPGMEWIQNRDRSGAPISETVALPVKDPMHIARAWLRLAELEERGELRS